MKKKLIVAVAAVLVLANGASVAFAESHSGSGSTTTSTTIAGGSQNTKLTDTQKVAYKAEHDVYRAKLEVIKTTFKTALSDAEKAFTAALVSGTPDAVSAASAFRTAGVAALQNYQDSLIALGSPPVKPEFSKEQKAILKAKRVVIMEAFRVAMKSAKDTYKKELAATDVTKKAAKSTFKAAVRKATQEKTDALKALGLKS